MRPLSGRFVSPMLGSFPAPLRAAVISSVFGRALFRTRPGLSMGSPFLVGDVCGAVHFPSTVVAAVLADPRGALHPDVVALPASHLFPCALHDVLH